jgi:hypothetical protein
MDQYQIRVCLAWYHHMSLVMVSTLFMIETRIQQNDTTPLLSCPDIATLFANFFRERMWTRRKYSGKWESGTAKDRLPSIQHMLGSKLANVTK